MDGRDGHRMLKGAELNREEIGSADVVVVLSDHSAFSHSQMAEDANAIIDTRNAFKNDPHNRDKNSVLGGGHF